MSSTPDLSSLGLNRYITRLVPHSPAWIEYAEAQCSLLKRTLIDQAIDVKHVGSTAVPDLPAKPIIDIAIGLRSEVDASETIAKLKNTDYLYRGDTGELGGHLFVKEISPDVSSVHIHAVEYDGRQWRNYLAFRDGLRQNADLRQRYAALKEMLADRFYCDREQYTDSKHVFIQNALSNASHLDWR